MQTYSPIAVGIWLVFMLPGLVAAQTGSIEGRVTDATTGSPLPGANVQMLERTLGAATTIEGYYQILNVPAGSQGFTISYIGYRPDSFLVDIPEGGVLNHDIQLDPAVLQSGEVTITAQAEGQAKAINQQLSAEQIVNVVSADRIAELPDQNAAESVGRLPGVAIQRDAGEGQKVLIRGLAPRYSAITVNGERVPSTDESDRSVDLSMLTADIVGGIELFKAITPDQDAASIGGTVNFVVRRAPEGLHGFVNAYGGYTALSEDFGQFRGSATVSNRFLDNKLGVLASGGAQSVPRPVQGVDAAFLTAGTDETGEQILDLSELTLKLGEETRERYSTSLGLDYDLGGGDNIRLISFYARTNRDIIDNANNLAPARAKNYFYVTDREVNISLWNNTLLGEHTLARRLEVDWRFNFASTVNKTPFESSLMFQENGAFTGDLETREGPGNIQESAKYDLTQSIWQDTATDDGPVPGSAVRTESIEEDLLAGALDVKLPFTLGRKITGYLKAGGKLRDNDRSRVGTEMMPFGINDRLLDEDPDGYEVFRGRLTVENFIDDTTPADDFLGGEFGFPLTLQSQYPREFWTEHADLYVESRRPILNDYTAGERVSAAYFMGKFDFGHRVMLLPGFRYEHTDNEYSGKVTRNLAGVLGEFGQVKDSTTTNAYGEWLPMVHLRAFITSSLDLRLAATRTLARPNYANLVPRIVVDFANGTINQGNPELNHTRAWNYDALLSFHSQSLGLLTVGGFYKRLDDVDYLQTSVINEGDPALLGFQVSKPVNALELTEVYGLEIEIQSGLPFLPGLLSGLVLNANYTRTFGETTFPTLEERIGPPPFFFTEFVAGERTGPVPGQSDHILNTSLGYETGGFSGRVTVTYQSDFLVATGPTAARDIFQGDFVRWDAVMTQRIASGWSVYWNLNNFTNVSETGLIGTRQFLAEEEDYGWTSNLGLRLRF